MNDYQVRKYIAWCHICYYERPLLFYRRNLILITEKTMNLS